jgi:hypothetical protein
MRAICPTHQGSCEETEGLAETVSYRSQVTVWATSTTTASNTATTDMPTALATRTVTVDLAPQLLELVEATPEDTRAVLLEDSNLTLSLLLHSCFVSFV